MGYWGSVLRQAWRETLEQVRWHSPMRLALAFGPMVVSGGFTWIATATPAYGALASVVTLLAVAAAWYLERLLSIPPRLAAEAADAAARSLGEATAERDVLEERLATYRPAKADTPLRLAVGYIISGRWEEPALAELEQVGAALIAIERKAFDNEIEIWGQTHQHNLTKRIPAEIWESKHVDLTGFFEDQPVQTQQLFDDKANRYRFINLSVVRAQIEREWPRKA